VREEEAVQSQKYQALANSVYTNVVGGLRVGQGSRQGGAFVGAGRGVVLHAVMEGVCDVLLSGLGLAHNPHNARDYPSLCTDPRRLWRETTALVMLSNEPPTAPASVDDHTRKRLKLVSDSRPLRGPLTHNPPPTHPTCKQAHLMWPAFPSSS